MNGSDCGSKISSATANARPDGLNDLVLFVSSLIGATHGPDHLRLGEP